jgi:hypothetical protein
VASGQSATRPKAASEGWITSDAAGTDLVGKEEMAEDQQDEWLDEDNGQSVRDGHDLDARNEGEGRDKKKERAQGGIGQRTGADAQRKTHQRHDRQHQRGLHREAREGDLADRNAVLGRKLGRNVKEGGQRAEGEHQDDALQGGVAGHGPA